MIDQASSLLEMTGDNDFCVKGPMVFGTGTSLYKQGCAMMMERVQAGQMLVCDLSNVDRVDSSALAVIFAWRSHVMQKMGMLQLKHPPERLTLLAQLYGVDNFFLA